MSRILHADGTLADDRWTVLGDEEAWPAAGQYVLSLQRWQSDPAPAGLRLGVSVPNTEIVDELDPALLDCPLIVLDIPKFADGRAYSQARLLRDRLRYDGEIRATGDVLVDQLFEMRRCGFSSFVLRADQSTETAQNTLRSFSLGYQHASTPLANVWERRRARSA